MVKIRKMMLREMEKVLLRVVGENKSEEDEDKDKEEEEEVESEEEDGSSKENEKDDDNASSMGGELRSKSQHDPIKTISIDSFHVEMPIDNPANLIGDFVVKSVMGKYFDKFRNIIKKEKLEDFFRSSCFGHFLKLPEDNNAHF
ncbi:hypothetical protein FXO38_20725 [Capsicum annuum]|nr:hypothetical protein FXO37_33699 [Capsicum annuum]KAF3643248.1 hypothetical protein FXO38_20725 [Capsicum annuum]